MKIGDHKKTIAFAMVATLAFSLLSPKWVFAPAAWVVPVFLLLTMRALKPGKSFLAALSVLFLSGLLANYKVMPFPGIFLVVITLQVSVLGAIPYFINRLFASKISGWKSTLLLPCLMVVYEYVTSFMGSGTWGSIVYTQVESLPLMQLASLTGLWGITFIIYWFAALVAWSVERGWAEIKVPAILYASAFLLIILFGTFRINPYFSKPENTVRVAGITALNLHPLRVMYRDAFGKEIHFDSRSLTQTSPELQELNLALSAFVEDPLNKKFERTHAALESFQDSLFLMARREAKAGARIISFSEALMFTVKPKEDSLIEKGKAFAMNNNVYLLLTMGSFIPGKIEFGKKYIENKALLIDPQGQVVNTFFKNKPVPLVEGSVAGDGLVPTVSTPFGNIATSICYDADFPQLMRQAGRHQTSILLLPSGDWKEVSPYHGNMARVGAIENGVSVLRPVSGATSMACDHYGRIVAQRDFYDNETKVLTAYLPVTGVTTLYAVLGDWFAYACMLYLTALAIVLIWKKLYTVKVLRPSRHSPGLPN